MQTAPAEIIREYGPFPGVEQVHGLTFDGHNVWFASGDRLNVMDPANGNTIRTIEVPARAGTAFDGRHIFQLAGDRIQKIDAEIGRVLSTIPAPDGASGMAWSEGFLWVGQYSARKIHQLDPKTGAILRSIETNRYVTGVTWVDGELWHGSLQDDKSELCQVDPGSGEELQRLVLPPGTMVSGLESDGADRFFCGGGKSGKVRVVRRPNRAKAA